MLKQFASAFSARITGGGWRGYQTYTHKDLQYFELAYASTLAGTTIDKLLEFVFGGGVQPTFELIDTKDKEDKQIQEELKQYDEILDELKQFDHDIRFNDFLKACATNALVFGRGVVVWDDPKMPKALKIIHPRDLNAPVVNENTWELEGVKSPYAEADTAGIIPTEEMIYLVNQPDSPIYRNTWYGYSMMQRIVGSARALQRITDYDAPEIAHSMWASYGLIIVNTEGKTQDQARTQLETILGGLKPGAFNGISGKPKEDVEYIPVDLEAKVADLVQLCDNYERLIIGNFGVPSALMGREEDSNMATLFGKIRLFVAGPVQSKREWISNTISKQWYERILKAKGHGDILEKVRVKAEFEPITIESWIDVVPALAQLSNAIPGFPDSAKLTLAGLEQFKDDLEKNKKEQEQKQQEMFNKGMDKDGKPLNKGFPPKKQKPEEQDEEAE